MATELEKVLADAARVADVGVMSSDEVRADLMRLLGNGQKPWVVRVSNGYEVLVQFKHLEA